MSVQVPAAANLLVSTSRRNGPDGMHPLGSSSCGSTRLWSVCRGHLHIPARRDQAVNVCSCPGKRVGRRRQVQPSHQGNPPLSRHYHSTSSLVVGIWSNEARAVVEAVRWAAGEMVEAVAAAEKAVAVMVEVATHPAARAVVKAGVMAAVAEATRPRAGPRRGLVYTSRRRLQRAERRGGASCTRQEGINTAGASCGLCGRSRL